MLRRKSMLMAALVVLGVAISHLGHGRAPDTAPRPSASQASASQASPRAAAVPSAVSPSGGSHDSSPALLQAAPAGDAARALWLARGTTIVPPGELLTPTSGGGITLVLNIGGVPEPAARAQVAALERTARWESWAVANGQLDLLANFVGDLHLIDELLAPLREARDKRGRIHLDHPLSISRAELFSLPESDIRYIARHGGVPSPTAWRVTYRGPVTATVAEPEGERHFQLSDHDYLQLVEAGGMRDDPMLGAIWQDSTRLDCLGAGRALTLCAT